VSQENPQPIDLGYEPRSQFIDFHTRGKRWACIVAHRRAGKTVACIMDLIDDALLTPKKGARFAYIAPHFNQAKDVAWEYVKQYAINIPDVTVNESELRVDFPNGSRVRLYGAENYDRLRGIFLDGVVLDEFADMDPRAWSEVIRPALSDREGWVVFIGTPKGHNTFHDIYQRARAEPDWFSLELKASETGILPDSELAASRGDMTADQYAQEYECSFDASIQGAYYATEFKQIDSDERITRVPAEGMPVHTAWDLGIGDSTAIWFIQPIGRELRVIDYYEASGVGLPHYAEVLQNRGYSYGKHYLPHDVTVRELGSGRSREETLRELGIKPEVVPRQEVDDGINAVRRILPMCWFDREKCGPGIEALRQYRTEFDERRKVFKSRPLHDWTSHAADAFRYFAVAWKDTAKKPARGQPPQVSWMG
jgi:hypothetical protein|tara:strand:+ start:3522 stop:4793 length:1272 start_codon:yes stop_codon:yes gene_type:complete